MSMRKERVRYTIASLVITAVTITRCATTSNYLDIWNGTITLCLVWSVTVLLYMPSLWAFYCRHDLVCGSLAIAYYLLVCVYTLGWILYTYPFIGF